MYTSTSFFSLQIFKVFSEQYHKLFGRVDGDGLKRRRQKVRTGPGSNGVRDGKTENLNTFQRLLVPKQVRSSKRILKRKTLRVVDERLDYLRWNNISYTTVEKRLRKGANRVKVSCHPTTNYSVRCQKSMGNNANSIRQIPIHKHVLTENG